MAAMRRIAHRACNIGVFAALCSAAIGQTPDLVIKADVSLNDISRTRSGSKVRWYDPMGRHSIVGVRLTLEPGYYVLVTERLQRIENDADREFLDEAYVEDPGSWRLGRQYLPFGSKVLVRESALAARFDRQFTLRGLPVVVAACDNGNALQRGVVARIGSSVGASVAYGQHFGVSGTCFTPFRRPEASPGPGKGYALLVGLDASRNFGALGVEAEYVGMRRGATSGDKSEDATDLRFNIRGFEGKSRFVGAWTRVWRRRADFFRVENELQVSRNIYLKSFLRIGRGSFSDIGVGVRIKF
jgi:hypothetical protein